MGIEHALSIHGDEILVSGNHFRGSTYGGKTIQLNTSSAGVVVVNNIITYASNQIMDGQYSAIGQSGTDSYVLTADPSFVPSIRRISEAGSTGSTGNNVAAINYLVIGETGVNVINLPTPTSPEVVNKRFIIKDDTGNASAVPYTIFGGGGDIDGSASYLINRDYQTIEVVSDGSKWLVLNQGNGPTSKLVVSETGVTATVASDTEVFLATSGGITVTLPDATIVGVGSVIYVKDENGNAGASNITIATQSAQTIDGASTLLINTNYGSYTLLSNGSNWSTI